MRGLSPILILFIFTSPHITFHLPLTTDHSLTTYHLPLTTSPPLAHAAYKEIYWSARVASLGGAYTAVSDDSAGIFYNPAASIKAKNKETSFSYARLFAGLDEVHFSMSHFAYLHPLNGGKSIGVGWGNFSSKDLYREDTVLISYGHDLKQYFNRFDGELSAGVSVRYLMRAFTLDQRTISDPVFKSGRVNRSATFDLHLYGVPEPNLFPGLSVGISIKNLNQPAVGFSEKERLPVEWRGGLLYRWKHLAFPFDLELRDKETIPHFGSEMNLVDKRVFLRLGSDLSQATGGFGYAHPFSEKYSIIIDYGFLWPLQLDSTIGSHRATFSLRF